VCTEAGSEKQGGNPALTPLVESGKRHA
jgi:hypothetical protein